MKYAVEKASCDIDTHTKFHEDWYRRSKVVTGDTHADTQTYTYRDRLFLKHTFIFSKIEESYKRVTDFNTI
jgi:hypothetical protein